MRFITPLFAVFAGVALAQQNAIEIPLGGLKVTADTPVTITWSDPSSGTITIKLQQGSLITPDTGLVVASGIQAAALTATFVIPADEVNSAQYNFEIIDDTNPYNYNFSPGFTVTGATGTGLLSAGTVSATGTFSTGSVFSLVTATVTSATATFSLSSQSATALSTFSFITATSTSTALFAAQTSVTNTNGAGGLTLHGGLLAVMLGAIAVF